MGPFTPSQSLPLPFGRYVLQGLLGEGGFARVYRAELQGPAGFRKTVAIKLMRELHPDRVQEIIHEGRVGGLLKHRNVVDTYELGMVDHQGFVSMEWVDGLSLKELLLTARPPGSVVLEIGLEMCRGLAYAHGLRGSDGSLGLVHLDLKPGNVLIGWDGSVKVADFGIARLTGLAADTPRHSLGTPAYLSPEQALRETVDARSDLFSLGAVLYEAATGKRLFSSDPNLLGQDRVNHIQQTLKLGLNDADAALPGLSPILARCLTVSREDRIPSAEALGVALRDLWENASRTPTLEIWLADSLGEMEHQWVTDVDSWNSGSAEETLDFAADETDFEDAIADLEQCTELSLALSALARAEQALRGVPIRDRKDQDQRLHKTLGRAGLEVVATGDHPYLVFDDKARTWCAGQEVIRCRVSSVMARLLYNIAIHGSGWSRERLYSEVWEQTYRPPSSDSALRMAVSRLRERLKGTGISVERLGDGQYAIAGQPGVLHWRGRPVESSVQTDSDPTAPPSILRTNLGREPNLFVGREADNAQVLEMFSTTDRVVTVLGPPGTGKTRFVKHLGAHQVDAGDGVWFCDLTEARTEEDVLTAVASTLGVPNSPIADTSPSERVGAAIAARGPVWLLIDNAEQVVEAVGRCIRLWWDLAPECRFLVTSRRPLNLPIERRYALQPLKEAHAATLFVARAQAVQARFTANASNQEDILAIVQELDGLPLAIELAAARMSLWPIKTLRERLRDRFRLLSRPQASGPRRQATLRGALDWSWELISPWERAAWAQCSVFRGGFTWEAAEAVIDLSPWPDAPWTVDVLGALVEHSLLTVRTDENGDGQLSMLVSVAAYGAEALTAMGENAVQDTERRHGEHYATYGEEHFRKTLNTDGGIRRIRLRQEFQNLVVATERAIAVGWAEGALKNCVAAQVCFQDTGPLTSGLALANAVMAMDLSPEQQADIHLDLGALKNLIGDMPGAVSHYSQALDIYRSVSVSRGESVAVMGLANRQREQGQVVDALANYTCALKIQRETGNRIGESICLNNVALLHLNQGQNQEAEEYFNRALEIHLANGNLRSEAIVRNNLCILQISEGRLEEAARNNQRSLEVQRVIGSRRYQTRFLSNRGRILEEQGRPLEAIETYQQTLDIHEKLGSSASAGVVIGHLARLYMSRGDMEKALEHYDRALKSHRIMNNRRYEALVIRDLGIYHANNAAYADANEHLERAESLLQEINDVPQRALVICMRGHVALFESKKDLALELISQANQIAAELGVLPTSQVSEEIQRLQTAIDEHGKKLD